MKRIWNNYKQTILILISIILGTIIGLVFKEKSTILKPFGDLFLNLMYVIIIPLVFLTITTSIAKINKPKRITKIFKSIFITFILTSLVAVLFGIITTNKFNLINNNEQIEIPIELQPSNEKIHLLDKIVQTISTNDFLNLLSKDHLIALVLISIITGIAISKTKEKELLQVLESSTKVILKILDIILIYAPIGLGCYFASLVGTFGNEIVYGYTKTFIIYTISSIFFYIVIYSLYALLAGGKKGLKEFWKNVIPISVTAISTCSSAASIPTNIKYTKNIGVSKDIAETTIPLGTSFHKDGSIIGSVFKIMFLVNLFNSNINIFKIALIALIANLLVLAIPIGGGTISELLILSLLNYPTSLLPILTIIATIIDPPATLLNVVGDTSSSMIVSRLVDGKNWLNKKRSLI